MNLLEESVLNLRVLPNDVDITKISNDRYVALMDLGRMDVGLRLGLRAAMVKKQWGPLVTLHTIRYRYPLKLFQKYQLKTRVIWWDDTTFYWEQIFERNGRVLATGHVSSTLMNKRGQIPSKAMIEEAGQTVTKPDEPEVIAKLREIEKLVHATQKD